MKIFSFLLLLIILSLHVNSQSILPLQADSVLIRKIGGNGELIIENGSRSLKGGILYNRGNGRTAFKKSVALNDSVFVVGGDTITIKGGISTPGNSGNFIAGNIAPLDANGFNGDYFWNQKKSHLYKKSGGLWGTPFAHLNSDTVRPFHSEYLFGSTYVLKDDWEPGTMSYTGLSIARNSNAIGNETMPFKDDPVVSRGWNVDVNGNIIDPTFGGIRWHDEAYFKTKPFVDSPYFESHISLLFKPGSSGYNYSGGSERIESLNLSQNTYDAYKYNTKSGEWWMWRLSPLAGHTTYFEISPDMFRGRKTLGIKDIDAGGPFLELDGVVSGTKEPRFGNYKYIFGQRFGFSDTLTFEITTGGASDFYIRPFTGGNGRTLFERRVGVGVDDYNGRAPVELDNNGQFFAHINGASSYNYNLSLHNGIYGIGLNTTSNRLAYLNITNRDQGTSFNTYWTNNNTDADSIANPINFFFERLKSNSASSADLYDKYGYLFTLNNANRFGTKFRPSGGLDNDGYNVADFVWESKQTAGTTMSERMKLSDSGYLHINSLKTTISAPATSGIPLMVIADANGRLSFSGKLGTDQVHTSGTSVTATLGVTRLYVDPSTAISSLSITLPATPYNGQIIKIFFGGDDLSAPSDTVVTGGISAWISPDAAIIVNTSSPPIPVTAGMCFIFEYRGSNNTWYQVQ